MSNTDDEQDDTFTIQPRPGVRVYQNPSGEVVVRNFSDEHLDSEDSDCDHLGCRYVRIHPDDAKAVAAAIRRVASEITGSGIE